MFTHPTLRILTFVMTLCVVGLFVCGFTASPTHAAKMTTAQAKAIAETLLGHLEKKRFGKALALMSPTIRQTIHARHLRARAAMNRRVLGTYRKGSLSLVSRLTRHRQTRYVWRATFQRERGVVLLLFDTKHHITGFVIQSRGLVKAMRKERPTSRPTTPHMQQFNKIADTLMRGYNLNKWALFCKHCSHVMKQVFAPKRFAALRAHLHKRYGAYQSRRFHEARTLVSLTGAIILRYKANFAKKQNVTLQFVLQRTKQSYQVAGWKMK